MKNGVNYGGADFKTGRVKYTQITPTLKLHQVINYNIIQIKN